MELPDAAVVLCVAAVVVLCDVTAPVYVVSDAVCVVTVANVCVLLLLLDMCVVTVVVCCCWCAED